jgi:hypothetical protein
MGRILNPDAAMLHEVHRVVQILRDRPTGHRKLSETPTGKCHPIALKAEATSGMINREQADMIHKVKRSRHQSCTPAISTIPDAVATLNRRRNGWVIRELGQEADRKIGLNLRIGIHNDIRIRARTCNGTTIPGFIHQEIKCICQCKAFAALIFILTLYHRCTGIPRKLRCAIRAVIGNHHNRQGRLNSREGLQRR